MNKLVVFLLVSIATVLGVQGDSNDLNLEGGRQKRLLFYDEEGNLVKTYNNPLRYDYTRNAEKIQLPMIGKFWNPFMNYLKPSYNAPTIFMIPVSDAVIRHLYSNPLYQTKLLSIPRKDLVIGPNARCEGQRTQIPADNCQNFLNCWDGWAMEQECPEGLLFSRDGYCDYEHNVDCTQRDRNPSTSSPTQGPSQPELGTPVAPEQPIAPPQPSAPQPPMAPQPPIAPQQPTAPLQPAAPQPPSTPQLPASAPQCNTEYETWRDAYNCSEFYVCVGRAPVKFQCPAELAYNQEYGVCDYKDRVNCNSNTNQPGPGIQQASGTMCSTPAPEAAKIPPSISGERPAISLYLGSKTPDGKTFVTSNAVYNTQSWSSSHVAISRQDALRQLKLGDIANVSS